jgi:hypothetical protein
MSHTPGPWAYENYDGTVHVFIDNEGGTPSICKLVGNDKDANARLIAAAPEMLEALEAIDSYWSSTGEDDWIRFFNTGLQPARAAIAKARGE